MQDIKAREAYLRRQRDHLIKMKNKAREDSLASSKKSPAKASPSKTKVTTSTEKKSKNIQAKGAQSKQETSSSLISGRKMNNTGVLCSAIADKLRIEQM